MNASPLELGLYKTRDGRSILKRYFVMYLERNKIGTWAFTERLQINEIDRSSLASALNRWKGKQAELYARNDALSARICRAVEAVLVSDKVILSDLESAMTNNKVGSVEDDLTNFVFGLSDSSRKHADTKAVPTLQPGHYQIYRPTTFETFQGEVSDYPKLWDAQQDFFVFQDIRGKKYMRAYYIRATPWAPSSALFSFQRPNVAHNINSWDGSTWVEFWSGVGVIHDTYVDLYLVSEKNEGLHAHEHIVYAAMDTFDSRTFLFASVATSYQNRGSYPVSAAGISSRFVPRSSEGRTDSYILAPIKDSGLITMLDDLITKIVDRTI